LRRGWFVRGVLPDGFGPHLKSRRNLMLWKMLVFHLIAMPVLMLAFFVLALSAPQLGMFNGAGLAWGAAGSFVAAIPVAWFLSREVSRSTRKNSI
jgi:hypothetical protein